ncbi:MAG: Threonylcarbamoyl-AMP synthase [Bacteroidia bacterium]|nr:Threonylcarbamoyl-AMP synthase [Bacteroidia bacterium]
MIYDKKILDRELTNALAALHSGGVILYPTDTVWGLGCDCTNVSAVEKIFKIKKRDSSKSLVLLVDNDARLLRYVKAVPEMAWELMQYSDKPLTIVYPEGKNVARNMIGPDKSIAIRVTSDVFCKKLISVFDNGLVSTSANISGKPSPQNFSDVDMEIINAVDYVVNLRQNEKTAAAPSSIIKVGMKGEIEIIRK